MFERMSASQKIVFCNPALHYSDKNPALHYFEEMFPVEESIRRNESSSVGRWGGNKKEK